MVRSNLLTSPRAGQIRKELAAGQMGDLLTHLQRCCWSIKIQSFKGKVHIPDESDHRSGVMSITIPG
jgi:hypothetical protein